MSGVALFRSQMDTANAFQLFKQEDPNNPAWCDESRWLVEWGESLLEALSRNISPGTVANAQKILADKYRQAIRSAPEEHQAGLRQATHPCVQRAYMDYGDKLEKLGMSDGIPEIERPAILVPQPTEVPAIAAKVDLGPSAAQQSGIPFGEEEVDEDEEPTR